MINNKKVLLILSFMLAMFIGCEDSDTDPAAADTSIETPTTYVFESRFSEGESSVYYNGQIVRNLLINDIKTQCGTDAGTGNPATLLSMMANDNESRTILTTTDPTSVQTTYRSISSSHLNDRLTAVSSYTIPGYDSDAGTLINGWVQELAAAGKTRPSGVRLDQMIQKTLWGAVSYWQGTSKYMSKIPTDDNAVSDDGDPWTAMEHHWDESFGYFGAARDYNTGYTDDTDRKSGPYNDSNSDGAIDFLSEYNVGWAVTAAKRDVCTGCADNDFTKTIMDAYLEGRTLIHNQAPLDEILVQRDIILNTWEKVVAAVSIHYVNDVMSDIATIIAAADTTVGPLSEASADYNNHWGEMRAYTHGLIYNDFKVIETVNLNRILSIMGTAPVYPSSGSFTDMQTYHDALAGEVKAIFKASYGFTDGDMANW
tara:strand:- start:2796 stop:4076 length:1281 start_codon:yes stop_codon:yes gene_type:complete